MAHGSMLTALCGSLLSRSMQITAASTARQIWDRYLTTTRRETDEASDAYRATTPPVLADRRATIVLITAVVVLLIQLRHRLALGRRPGRVLRC